MRIYNTLSRRKEEFVPLKAGEVGFYVCGPTVYNHIHIGNARTFISFDVIRRYLEYRGYNVRFVQNITDVDDKIINRAFEEGTTTEDIAQKYTKAFVEMMQAIGVKEPTVRPKATEEIPTMVSLIEGLVLSQHAYVVDNDVYFAVRSYAGYGELSRRNIDHLISGFRVDVDERKNDALDFALWKAAKAGEPAWESPWGLGRPGWHIECSAMSRRYLGESFDIHGGGEDLIFPHHENEIAQSKAAGDGFARYWLHCGMLTINDEKMSKSTGNYLLLKDVLGQVSPQALRLLMLQTHYRSPFDYSSDRSDEATAALMRVENSLRNLDMLVYSDDIVIDDRAVEELQERIAIAESGFQEQMDDDFNTAGAIAAIFALISHVNTLFASGTASSRLQALALQAAATIRNLLAVLGVDLASSPKATSGLPDGVLDLARLLLDYQGDDIGEAADALAGLRAKARTDKDWPVADAVRDGLSALGIIVEDTPRGTRMFLNTRLDEDE